MSTIQDDILDRIRRHDRGKVFTPKDFLESGAAMPLISRCHAW